MVGVGGMVLWAEWESFCKLNLVNVIQQQHSSGFGCWCHHRPLRSLLPRCRLYSDSLLTFLISVNPWAVGTPLHAPLLIAHTDGGGGPAAVHAAVCWPLLLLGLSGVNTCAIHELR